MKATLSCLLTAVEVKPSQSDEDLSHHIWSEHSLRCMKSPGQHFKEELYFRSSSSFHSCLTHTRECTFFSSHEGPFLQRFKVYCRHYLITFSMICLMKTGWRNTSFSLTAEPKIVNVLEKNMFSPWGLVDTVHIFIEALGLNVNMLVNVCRLQ